MNQEIKDRWIKALESRAYKKGDGHLRNGDTKRYCCLGVLSDILKDQVGGRWNGSFFEETAACPSAEHHQISNTYLTTGVRELAVIGSMEQIALATLNDSSDTFEPVIAYIKENL